MDALSGEIRTTFAMPDHKHSFVRFAPDARTLLCSSGEQALFVHLSETCSTVFSSRSGARAVQADFDQRGGTAAIITEEGNGLVVRFPPATSAKELSGRGQAGDLEIQPGRQPAARAVTPRRASPVRPHQRRSARLGRQTRKGTDCCRVIRRRCRANRRRDECWDHRTDRRRPA